MSGRYEVVACAASFETDLRPANVRVATFVEATPDGSRTLFRPTTRPETPGACFGRVGRFLRSAADDVSDGRGARSAVESAARDAESLRPGTLKQKIYHFANDMERVSMTEADRYLADGLRRIEARRNAGEIDEETAARLGPPASFVPNQPRFARMAFNGFRRERARGRGSGSKPAPRPGRCGFQRIGENAAAPVLLRGATRGPRGSAPSSRNAIGYAARRRR